MKVTACECEQPGYCERHQCEKSRVYWELCQRRADWFSWWEAGDLNFPARSVPRERCRHRSLEPIDQIVCDTCPAQAAVAVPVYACERFQRCAEPSFGLTAAEQYRAMSCARCEEYVSSE